MGSARWPRTSVGCCAGSLAARRSPCCTTAAPRSAQKRSRAGPPNAAKAASASGQHLVCGLATAHAQAYACK
eukprot:2171336-Pleurochrysis_carterae.AAC.1